jgi:hypothetical protein
MTQGVDRGSGPSIVGGQPSGGRGQEGPAVTVGVERILYDAATDDSFRTALLADRQGALADRGISLKPSEEAVLATVPDVTLESMIDAIHVPDHRRRRFIKAVAAVSAGSAGVVMLNGCIIATGVRPEDDADVDPQDATVDASALEDVATVTGIRPAPPEPEDTEDPQNP